jgi:menaquinone-dependent protoporphyrinogen oxidase
MRFLVVYATTEGHTRKVAEHVADRLHALGQRVALHDATDAEPDADFADVDAVVVAASLHEGRYQTGIVRFVTNRHGELSRTESVFLPVSLSAASSDADDRANLDLSVERFMTETAWRPNRLHHVMGALRCDKGDFFRRWSMKLIVKDAGAAAGPTVELTDWIALTETVDALVSDLDRTRPEFGLFLAGGNGTKAVRLREPHTLGTVQRDKALPCKRRHGAAHRLHR